MPWWRRDPSVWCRSPINRYARRSLLHDNEAAALRTRCFSRSPPTSAKHNDENAESDPKDSENRPPGLSNLEWLQLQRYRHWRRKLREDPYWTLFGASNDMLSGKGLKDWEWVYKAFPKWMLREMDADSWGARKNGRRDEKSRDSSVAREYGNRNRDDDRSAEQAEPSEKKYPRKVNIVDEIEGVSGQRESVFPEPSFRPRRFERNEWAGGVVSPSDTRRPSERPVMREDTKTDHTADSVEEDVVGWQDIKRRRQPPVTPKVARPDNSALRKEVSARESSFIEEFFADAPESKGPSATISSDNKAWRQTVLDRRSAQGFVSEPKVDEPNSIISERMASEAIQIPASQADDYPVIQMPPPSRVESTENVHENTGRLKENRTTILDEVLKETLTKTRRSASEVLEQLPKDDLDFLSASDIRASMGSKRRFTESSDVKQQTRQDLEKDFEMLHKNEKIGLSSMMKSNILNDQLIRRTTRKLQEGERLKEAQRLKELERLAELSQEKAEEPLKSQPVSEPQLETSIDRMTKWLQTSGDTFAQHFWQDPVQVTQGSVLDGANARSLERLIENITTGLKKGRLAMDQVVQDLAVDIEATKPLLTRLKNDEKKLEHTLKAALRSDGCAAKRTDISRKLRKDLDDTHKEFEFACVVLEEIHKMGVREPPRAFKQRLRHAAEVLHKNARLTRLLMFRLQGRIDSQEVESAIALQYRDLAYRLLALQDTQLALSRLVDRAMQVYRVWPVEEPETPKKEDAIEVPANEARASVTTSASGPVRNPAAEKYLAEEVLAQKSGMQGLSDDGYSRSPKVTLKKSFEETSPLAHSLFRPFGLQLDSLGKEVDYEASSAKDAIKKKVADEKLVKEVKSAYEDVYGPITVEHRQPGVEGLEAEDAVAKPTPSKSEEKPGVEDSSVLEIKAIPEGISTDNVAASRETKEVVKDPIEETASRTIEVQENEAKSSVTSSTISKGTISSVETSTSASDYTQTSAQSIPSLEYLEKEEQTTSSPTQEPQTNLPTNFEILTYDTQKDQISITFTSTPPPRDISPPIPLHQALDTLDNPSKFLPHITPGTEIVSAKRDMLILRDRISESGSSTSSFETLKVPPIIEAADSWEDTAGKTNINPIDGTTRLSPTGYVGFDELESEFDERRRMADEHSRRVGAGATASEKGRKKEGRKESRKGGGFASVMRTAILAGATCYVFGVAGEVLRG